MNKSAHQTIQLCPLKESSACLPCLKNETHNLKSPPAGGSWQMQISNVFNQNTLIPGFGLASFHSCIALRYETFIADCMIDVPLLPSIDQITARLLLGDAMNRSQPPNQIVAVDPHNSSPGKTVRQHSESLIILRTAISRYEHLFITY